MDLNMVNIFEIYVQKQKKVILHSIFSETIPLWDYGDS